MSLTASGLCSPYLAALTSSVLMSPQAARTGSSGTPGDDRELVVALGEVDLGLGRGQVFQELDRVVAMRRGRHDAGAADVGVGAAPVLVGEDDPDLVGDRPLVGVVRLDQPDQVVVIDHGDVALAGRHRLDLVGVGALRRTSEVRDQALRPGLGLLEPQTLDHRADQRLVVDIVGGAHADPSPPFGVGEVLVGVDLARVDPVLGIDDDAQPQAEAEPLALGVAQAGRDALVEERRGRPAAGCPPPRRATAGRRRR